MKSWFQEAFGRWYPVVYPHRDEGEARALIDTLSREFSLEGQSVLDVGCGAGRHLLHVRRAGASPVGLDLSKELLKIAQDVRAEAKEAWPLIRADMRSLPIAPERFDLVTSLFTSFGYFSREDDDEIVLREAQRVLAPGGYHLLDFLNRELVAAHPNPQTERIVDGVRILESRRIEEDRRVVKRVVLRDDSVADSEPPLTEYEERVTLYSEAEMRSLLRRVGLEVVATWGEYDGRPFAATTSSRLILLSRKAPA